MSLISSVEPSLLDRSQLLSNPCYYASYPSSPYQSGTPQQSYTSSTSQGYSSNPSSYGPSASSSARPRQSYPPAFYQSKSTQTPKDASHSAPESMNKVAKAEKSYPCPVPGCPSAARGSKFTRAADLDRHMRSMHYPTYTDCPHKWCGRTGSNGFVRKDHLNEHIRQKHIGVPPPRRAS
ncbi:hypothetical protein MMC30_009107 [Trapelia coarctata]|nr:hypothetical protein [Trapelia coarctata]